MPFLRRQVSQILLPSQHGRVHFLVIGSLATVATLWLGAGAISAPEQASDTLSAAMSAADIEYSQAAALGRSAIEEMEVTAPRIVLPKISFEQPGSEVALSTPVNPERYWNGTES